MTISRKGWKKYAKFAMQGRTGILILGMLLTNVASVVANYVTNCFFSGNGVFNLILAELFSFIVSLILGILLAGYSYMNLKIARYQQTGLGDLFYFFKNESDRVIIAGFILAVIRLISSIPLLIFNYTSVIGETVEELLNWEIHFLILLLIALILQMILSIPFSMAYYLLADHPEMGGIDAIKQSMAMMKNHMGSYLLMRISFFPWFLLSIFTFYIALIWVLPYINMTEAEFYRDLNGEFIVQSAYVEEAKEDTPDNDEHFEA